MNRMTERISSLNFAVWTLVVLFFWVGWGVVLAANKDLATGLQEMNRILVRDWLMNGAEGALHYKIWFIGLCLGMGVMGVNLVFCTWNRIIKILNARFSGPKLFMLIVHLIFGLVVLGHFGGFMLGYKHGDVPMTKGDEFEAQDGLRMKVTDVHFVDDPQVLKKSRREIMRGELNYKANYAAVSLSKGDRQLAYGRVYLLKPFHHANIQITLKRFLPPKGEGDPSNQSPGVMLSISSNPVLNVFLIIYPLMILGIGIHLIMTWRPPEKGDPMGDAVKSVGLGLTQK